MLYLYLADWSSFFRLCKMAPKSDIIVLVATFFLTVFFDLVVAIEIGVVLAALLFMKRMAETADIKAWKYTDSPDITPGEAENCVTSRIPSVFLKSAVRCFSPQQTRFLISTVTIIRRLLSSVCVAFLPLMPAQCVLSMSLPTVQNAKYHAGILPCQ